MASNKKSKLDDLLGEDVPQGIVKKGAGLHTSLDLPDQKDTIAQTHFNTSAKTTTTGNPQRIARGYKFREDLIKQCKQIALDEDRKLYEVMEEALEEYIARKHARK